MPPEASIPAGYTPATDLLKDRVILITGASGGVGSAAALACARHGASVVLLGRNVKKLEKVYDAIVGAGLPQPAIYPMNLAGATWNDLAELVATVERETRLIPDCGHSPHLQQPAQVLAEITRFVSPLALLG